MDYEITVDIPTAGDTSVLIVGLGEIRNGSTIKVDSEQARQFKIFSGVTLGRANFQEGITVKALAGGKKAEASEEAPRVPDEPPHPADQPAPVQNKDGETAATAKDGDK